MHLSEPVKLRQTLVQIQGIELELVSYRLERNMLGIYPLMYCGPQIPKPEKYILLIFEVKDLTNLLLHPFYFSRQACF